MKTIKAKTLDLSVNLEIGESKKILQMREGFIFTAKFMESTIAQLRKAEVKEQHWMMLLNGQGDELKLSDQEKQALLDNPPTSLRVKMGILSTVFEATVDELENYPNDVITNLWDHMMEGVQEYQKK